MQPTNNGSEAQNAPVADSEPMTRTDLHDAFLGELQQHKAILYKVATAYCSRREDRGDLIQDITIELFTAYPKFDARVARFSTWMYRIAMNVAISAHRGDSRRIRDALSIDWDLSATLRLEVRARTDYRTNENGLRVDLSYRPNDGTSVHCAIGDDMDFLSTSSIYSLFETPMDGSAGLVLYAVHVF